MKNILLVEPDASVAKLIKDFLKKDRSLKIWVASDAQTAIHVADKISPDLVILELALAGHNGLAFLYEFRSYGDWATVPVIVHSSLVRDPKLVEAQLKEMQIDKYFYKYTTDLQTLKNAVYKLLK